VNLNDCRTAYRLARIRELLQAGDMNIGQIATAIVMTRNWTKPYVDHLIGQGEIHIAGWVCTNDKGPYTPILRFGQGKPARRPKQITNAEKQKRARARLQQDMDRYDQHLASRRVKLRINSIKTQSWFAALEAA
jgi:hypothetical protein